MTTYLVTLRDRETQTVVGYYDEAAERRGEHTDAYQACQSEADAGDAECQNLVGYLFQEGLGVPLNATEAIRLFRVAAKGTDHVRPGSCLAFGRCCRLDRLGAGP